MDTSHQKMVRGMLGLVNEKDQRLPMPKEVVSLVERAEKYRRSKSAYSSLTKESMVVLVACAMHYRDESKEPVTASVKTATAKVKKEKNG